MKITHATVDMSSGHDFSSESEIKLHSESSFRTIFAQVSDATASSSSDKTGPETQLLLMLETLIARMLAIITGNKESQAMDLREVLQTDVLPESDQRRPRAIVEMEWKTEKTESIREQESTRFSSTGKIETTDGRVLDFDLSLTMNRNYVSERTLTESGKAELRDPLVINFGGNSAELSGKRFTFDLDADGKSESICGLGSSSGYLAIDSNGDGCINNGSELFGTRSGDGFADLSRLDSDGNHWLDEADAAYDSLRIWKNNGTGQESLSTLRDAGVGALYLGSTETSFDLTDDENRLLAHIRASGVYLMENGNVGSLQQVDLTI